ncbi:uncharacterized protein LOC135209882 [Macrobrachium nipponense]|uniref:uncharacterized protein LOC135209882 n=1 Tax=Macrobrachium nipponense TaxID=159736 RepID=UPI0030C7BAEA
MNLEEDYPAGKTPRRLEKLCAEKFANDIALRALPLIELYFCFSKTIPGLTVPSYDFLLNDLLRLKTFFWDGTYPWLGYKGSFVRKMVNEAIADILDYHTEIMEGARYLQVFTLFTFQLLFQLEAGRISTRRYFVINPVSGKLQRFLEVVGPFSIRALYSSCIIFHEAETFALLLKYSPNLKFIQLHRSYNEAVLEKLQVFCPTIEDIEIDITSCEDCENVEESLCKTFFRALDKRQIIKRITKQQRVDLSFPNLKTALFYSSDEHRGPSLNWLVFFLKYLCPELKTKWCCSIDEVSLMPSILKSGIWCPFFVKEAKSRMSLDGLAFHLEDSEGDDPTPHEFCLQLFLQCNYIFIDFNGHEDVRLPNFVEVLLRKFKCHGLKLLYSIADSEQLASTFQGIGSTLKELYLDGPLFTLTDGEQLYAILNSCPSLNVLSLQLDLIYRHFMERLNELTNLEVLSVKVANFPLWNNFPYNEPRVQLYLQERIQNFMTRHSIRDDLPAYLNSPGQSLDYVFHCFRDTLENSEESEDYIHPSVDINSWMRSLCHSSRAESIKKLFGPGPLRYDLSAAGSGFYIRERSSSSSDEDGSSGPSFLPIKPENEALSYFGNVEYVYCTKKYKNPEIMAQAGSDSKSKTTHHTENINVEPTVPSADAFHSRETVRADDGALNYGIDLKRAENELRQWRLDMDYGAPVALLDTLIHSSPNLKVLEIPDLRLTDPFHIFSRHNLLSSLSKVHTLHLTCQFTTPLVYSLANLISLKRLRIDLSHGVDNFLRFKRKLRTTDIVIESGGSLVYPGSNVSLID